MANNHTNLQATNPDGGTFHVQHTSTDSPILPAQNLAQLQQVDPALVPFVVKETELEASHRRSMDVHTNRMIFTERMTGLFIGGVVTLFVFALAGFLIYKGHDWAGVSISGFGLASIVALFVNRQNNMTEQLTRTAASTQAAKKSPRQTKPKKLPPGN